MSLNIKSFEFPTFEDWVKNKYETVVEVGDYYCNIKAVLWSSKSTTYECAISTYVNTANLYVKKVFEASKEMTEHHEPRELKDWYNNVIKEVNRSFSEYIISTYIAE